MRDQPDLVDEASGVAWRNWLHRSLLLLVLGLFAAATWRKSGDPIVDFGCELYVPWQITQGKHLYRDMGWLGGPLAQYANALAFALFGVSLTTLIWVNLVLLALLTELIRSYFARCVSPAAGLVAGLLFLTLFGFGQYAPLANYNYIAPYRHEPIRGILLSIGALHGATQALAAWTDRPDRANWWAGLSGLLFGGILLTKLEMVVATGGALAAGFVIGIRRARIQPPAKRKDAWTLALWFMLGAMALPVGFVAYLSLHMPMTTALRGTLGNLVTILSTNPTQQTFYRHVLGLDAWEQHVNHIATGCGVVGAAVLGILVAERWIPRRWHSALGLGGALVMGWLCYQVVPWDWFANPFPVLLALTAAGLGYASMVAERESKHRQWLSLLMWNVLALGLLGRLGLAVRLGHYGFALAMPAFLLLAVLALFVFPDVIRRQHAGTGQLMSGVATGFLIACTVVHLQVAFRYHEKKTQVVGAAGDYLMTYAAPWSPVGLALSEAITELSHELPPRATLLVMPEGITLNYWLRRENPTTFLAFDPYYLTARGGEPAVIAELERRPPDFIALTRRDMREYGVGWFGEDPNYGRDIMVWVSQRYEVARIFGEWEEFGVVLLRRRDASRGL
ncbi:hypothetical protein J8C06_04115 [Chloracidobacterium validum]|uniref:Glycosyltransferase RgtA/B/C/D-like domain-containing protein n=1 Tax=Chloracidobacterium validum TaxID=2821543 RepID=A0ABX8BDA8_9BACT|nr:hypothetical protein [Chloracidobacterium validum]QUW03628.1 hypothetical protein J8C06_04115 [Chloracidobacterium validum]